MKQPQRHTLEEKITALDLLRRQNNNRAKTCAILGISKNSLAKWKKNEETLQRDYLEFQRAQLNKIARTMHIDMLARGQAILKLIDDETLENASLDQLANILTALVTQALKLREVAQYSDETQHTVRFEHYYDGAPQETPPWTGTSQKPHSTLQSRSLRTPMGQNRTRTNNNPPSSPPAE